MSLSIQLASVMKFSLSMLLAYDQVWDFGLPWSRDFNNRCLSCWNTWTNNRNFNNIGMYYYLRYESDACTYVLSARHADDMQELWWLSDKNYPSVFQVSHNPVKPSFVPMIKGLTTFFVVVFLICIVTWNNCQVIYTVEGQEFRVK